MIEEFTGDKDQFTIPYDDTYVIDSPLPETQLLSLDANTKVLDVSETRENSKPETFNDSEKEVALDSDDEREHREGASTLPHGAEGHLVGSERRLLTPAGCLRRLDSRLSGYSLQSADSTRTMSTTHVERSAWPTFFHSDPNNGKQIVTRNIAEDNMDDQVSNATNAKKSRGEQIYGNGMYEGKVKRSFSSVNSETLDGVKNLTHDYDIERVTHIGSPEAEALSQAGALDFVDQYLSACEFDLPRQIEPTKVTSRGSAPTCRVKGPHILARRINLKRIASESLTFNWDEKQSEDCKYPVGRKQKNLVFRLEQNDPQSLSFHEETCDVGSYDGNSPGSPSKEKLPQNTLAMNGLVTEVTPCNQINRVVSNSRMINDFAMFSEKQVENGENGGVIHDTFDVGFDTQMAAEAMEALVHAPLPVFDAYLSKTINERNESEHCRNTKKAFSEGGDIKKQSKCKKSSSKKLNGIISCSSGKDFKRQRGKSLVSEDKMISETLTEKDLNSTNIATTENRKYGMSRIATVRRKEDPVSERDCINEVKWSVRVRSFRCGSDGDQLPRDEANNFSNGAPRTKRRSLAIYSRKTEVSIDCSEEKRNDIIGNNVPRKRRKMTTVRDNVYRIQRRGKSSNFSSFSPYLAAKENIKREEQFQPNAIGAGSFLELSPWSHPRRRRTHRSSRQDSNRSSNQKTTSVVTQEKNENDKSLTTVAGLVVYTLRGKPTSERKDSGTFSKQNPNDFCSSRLSIYQSADATLHGVPTNLDRAQSSVQSGEVTNLQSIPSVDTCDRLTLDVSSNRSCKSSMACSVAVDFNERGIKGLSGLSLLKVYSRRGRHSSERRRRRDFRQQNAGERGLSVLPNCQQVDEKVKLVPSDLHGAKLSKQSGKIDIFKSPPSIDNLEDAKLDVLVNGNSEPPVESVCKGNSNCEKSCKQNLSRSSLVKELTRLGYTKSPPDFVPRGSRRRKSMANICILFSQSLDADILKQQKKIVARLGFSIASCCSEATHFVTERFQRTRNMLLAIALGKPVVTYLWLESCGQAGCFIDERSYILRDDKKEKEIGFSMPTSLAIAAKHPLLQGQKVITTPNVKPGLDVIRSLVQAVQGQNALTPQIVEEIQSLETKDEIISDMLIISCEEDYAMCVPFLENGASVYSSELLFNGIIIQKLEHERHQLFKDYVKRNCTGICSKDNIKIHRILS